MAERVIQIPSEFQPREYQLPLLKAMEGGITKAAITWHRRSGKEKTCFAYMSTRAARFKGMYFYLFPTYTQGRKILWEGADKTGFRFLDHIPAEFIEKKNDQEMKLELKNGSIIRIVGTDKDVDSLVGTNPIGAVYSEFSLQDPRAADILSPIFAENGGWQIFNFTPRGENHAYELMEMAKNDKRWFWEVLTVDDTAAISQEILEQERAECIRKNGDDAIFLQEYYCSFVAAIQGAYYGALLNEAILDGRIGGSIYDARMKVHTAWDLGMDDSTTIIFFQAVGKEIRIIDYVEASGEGLAYYAKQVREKPYVYSDHYLPHDVEVRDLSANGMTRKQILQGLGIDNIVVVQAPRHKEDGIEAVRSYFNRFWIDKNKCSRLIKAIKNYSKRWDEKNKTYIKTPVHDWSSHGCDALQTLSLGFKEMVRENATAYREPNLDPYY